MPSKKLQKKHKMPWTGARQDFIFVFNTTLKLYFLPFLSMLKFSNNAREHHNFADAEVLAILSFCPG